MAFLLLLLLLYSSSSSSSLLLLLLLILLLFFFFCFCFLPPLPPPPLLPPSSSSVYRALLFKLTLHFLNQILFYVLVFLFCPSCASLSLYLFHLCISFFILFNDCFVVVVFVLFFKAVGRGSSLFFPFLFLLSVVNFVRFCLLFLLSFSLTLS